MSLERVLTLRRAATLAAVLTLSLVGCGGGSHSAPAPVQTSPSVAVSVSPTSATVQAGQAKSFSATVTQDAQNKGVTWLLSGTGCAGSACGTLSAASGASGAAVMYTAPAAPPTPPTVTLTATSVTDVTKSSAATITVSATTPPPAIVVSVSPTMSSVQVSASQAFVATLQNDSQNKGVNWSLFLSGAPCTANACGAVSPATSMSGIIVTYTAPASLPSGTLALTATSIADATKSAVAAITVTGPAKIAVTVTPATSNVATGGVTQTFSASLQNDAQNQGVTWTLSGANCTGTGCGTVSPASTLSGAMVTYTSPASAATLGTVEITATSVSDGTVSASASITLTAPPTPTPSRPLVLGTGQVDSGYGVPVIATDTAGNINVAWVNANGPEFVRSTDSGNTFTTAINIPSDLSNTLDPHNDIQIGLDGNGNINLLWHRDLTATSTVPASFFSHSLDGGATFSTPVNPGTATSAQLVVAPNGKITILWFDQTTANLLAVNSSDGITFSAPTTVWAAVGSPMDLTAAVGPQGQIYVFWTQAVTMSNCSILSSSSVDGSKFTPAVSISDHAGSCNQMPSETIDSSGNINVTWDADGASLFFSRSTNAAATFSVAVSIPTSPSPSLQKIAVGSDGNIYVLWQAGSILFSRSVDGGTTFSATPVALALAAGITPPSVGVDSCDNVTTVGQGNNVRTVYQRSVDGGLTFAAPIDISDFPFDYEQQLAVDKSGNAHIVWGVDGPPDIEYVRIPTTCRFH
jgi:hypothetical protein